MRRGKNFLIEVNDLFCNNVYLLLVLLVIRYHKSPSHHVLTFGEPIRRGCISPDSYQWPVTVPFMLITGKSSRISLSLAEFL